MRLPLLDFGSGHQAKKKKIPIKMIIIVTSIWLVFYFFIFNFSRSKGGFLEGLLGRCSNNNTGLANSGRMGKHFEMEMK